MITAPSDYYNFSLKIEDCAPNSYLKCGALPSIFSIFSILVEAIKVGNIKYIKSPICEIPVLPKELRVTTYILRKYSPL